MRDLILGIDLGTTACKAVIVDLSGRVISTATTTYPVHTPHPSWIEQDAEEVWQGMVSAVQHAVHNEAFSPERIAAVSFSAAMHGLMLLDKSGRPLTRCLIWADRRSLPQAQRVQRESDAHALYLRTGCPVQPLFWLSKLLWLQEQCPQVFATTSKCVTIKSYIIQRLIGRYVLDLSNASATGLLNTHTLTWDSDILQMVGLEPTQLPELVLPEEMLGTIVPHGADAFGLLPDTVLVAGGGDGGLANLGVGAVEPGQVASSIGTSGAVRTVVQQPRFDARERTWCYVLSRGTWFVGGAINNGGVVYQWLGNQLWPPGAKGTAQSRDLYKLLDNCAAQITPGAEGLIFLPFLLGERNPGWRTNARGILFGLSTHHTYKHIVRATVEGVALRLYSILQVLEDLLGNIHEIRVTGGLAHSSLWMSILADVYGYPLSIPKTQQSSALGAVFLAMKALGHIRHWVDVRQFVTIERIQQPDYNNHQLYLRLYKLSQQLYQDVAKHYDELDQLLGTARHA